MKIFEIVSTQNDLVKYCVKLQDAKFRKKEKKILVDGVQTIEGLINDKIEFEYLFLKKDNPIKDIAKVENLIFVNDDILKKISTTKSPTTLIGIVKEPEYDLNLFKCMKKIALIDGIKDAGNLGTIIRSAVAFSIDGIILFGDCVDLYNTKTIRATAQNIFKIPIIRTKDINCIKEMKKTHELVSTVVDGDKEFCDVDFKNNFIVSFGSEANGISKEIAELSNEKVTLKMYNGVESLNLGVCASIAFYFMNVNIRKK